MKNSFVIEKLIEKNITISFAESCTGGALSSALTKVSGVSKIFSGSFITYSIDYKIKYLGVNKETIDLFGVVSEKVAVEMVKGLKEITNAKLTVSVTGNAGPKSCDDKEDVGKIYIAICYNDKMYTYSLSLSKKREENINDIVDYVFKKIGELVA